MADDRAPSVPLAKVVGRTKKLTWVRLLCMIAVPLWVHISPAAPRAAVPVYLLWPPARP